MVGPVTGSDITFGPARVHDMAAARLLLSEPAAHTGSIHT